MQRMRSSVDSSRRTVLKAGFVIGAAQIASPFVIKARGEQPIRIGVDNPSTGPYASIGKNENFGYQLAVDEINAKGGILGGTGAILFQEATSTDTAVAAPKAPKRIQGDGADPRLGNRNSSMSLAIGQVSNELKTLQIVAGGHTDAVTGSDCHWNVFRVCSTTQMEANAVASSLIKNAGKRWYYLTPDYAFGHTLQAGMEKAAAKLGGYKIGADLIPVGTPDFSSYLIKAQADKPDAIMILMGGDDMVNALKQAVQFGLHKQFHLAGGLQELENLEGLPPEARVGTWVFEWYWKQPNVPHIKEFIAEIRKRTDGKVPTARHWFGYVSVWTGAHAANGTKSLDAMKMAKFLQNWKLPPDIALMPNESFYREGDNQLMPTLYVGHAQEHGADDPEDLFVIDEEVKGVDAAPPVAETGCKMKWPA